MKRVLVLVLVLAFSVTMFAMPASASELDDTNWVSVFDITNFKSLHSYTNKSALNLSITLPEKMPVYYYDIVIQDIGGNLDGSDYYFTVGNEWAFTVNVVSLGRDYYRIYGYNYTDYAESTMLRFNLGFTDGTYTGSIYFVSFRFSTLDVSAWDIECYCAIAASSYESTIHYVPSDDVNHRMFDGGADYDSPALSLNIWCDDWKKYDYIDYVLYLDCYSVTSVSCYFDGQPVPIDISFSDNSNSGSKGFTYVIRLDLRGLDRTRVYSDDVEVTGPVIAIDGQTLPDAINTVAVVSCAGGIYVEQPDASVSWLKRISNTLTNLYNSLLSPDQGADDFNSIVNDKEQELSSMTDQLNSIERPSIDSVQSDVSDIVSTDDLVLASQPFAALMGDDIIFSLFSMSLILCLASYVFFGKK